MLRFENPVLLNLLWALALQGLLLWFYWNWRQRTLRQLGSPALAERLMVGFSQKRFWLKNVLFAAAVVLVTIAIANPQQAVRRTPPPQSSADVLIALDISKSMLAKDAKPSRLEEAKTFVRQLAEALEGERLGLIFFAGDAYAQMPLSTDVAALMLFVQNANTDFITDQGTDVVSAIELATRLFDSGSEAGRALIIVSDGEHHEADVLIAARKARAKGIAIHTVSVGASSNSTIPLPGGGFKRDFNGQVVRSNANPILLRDVAKAGGGITLNTDDGGAVKALVREVDSLQKSAVEARAYTEYESWYQWLALAALLLLALEQLLWWQQKS
jgi:Ca-activated chloride channel family protein